MTGLDATDTALLAMLRIDARRLNRELADVRTSTVCNHLRKAETHPCNPHATDTTRRRARMVGARRRGSRCAVGCQVFIGPASTQWPKTCGRWWRRVPVPAVAVASSAAISSRVAASGSPM